MKLKTREVYGAVIVDIEGHLVGGPNSETFRRYIEGLLDQQKKRIIVNLHRVPWANSQGVVACSAIAVSLTEDRHKSTRIRPGDICAWIAWREFINLYPGFKSNFII